MTDRELLENAAKAAGIEIYESTDGTIQNRPVWVFSAGGGMGTMPYEEQWNPLLDDGQALRLAVKFGLHARQFPILDDGFDAPLGMVEVWRVDDDDPVHVEFLRSGDDRLAATRRAIVRAAAEIGRAIV